MLEVDDEDRFLGSTQKVLENSLASVGYHVRRLKKWNQKIYQLRKKEWKRPGPPESPTSPYLTEGESLSFTREIVVQGDNRVFRYRDIDDLLERVKPAEDFCRESSHITLKEVGIRAGIPRTFFDSLEEVRFAMDRKQKGGSDVKEIMDALEKKNIQEMETLRLMSTGLHDSMKKAFIDLPALVGPPSKFSEAFDNFPSTSSNFVNDLTDKLENNLLQAIERDLTNPENIVEPDPLTFKVLHTMTNIRKSRTPLIVKNREAYD